MRFCFRCWTWIESVALWIGPTFSANLTNTGTFKQSSSSFSTLNNGNFTNVGTLTMTGTISGEINGGTIMNTGTVNFTSTEYLFDSNAPTLVNEAGVTIDIHSEADFTVSIMAGSRKAPPRF